MSGISDTGAALPASYVTIGAQEVGVVNYGFAPLDIRRYGAVSGLNCTTAVANAILSAQAQPIQARIRVPDGSWFTDPFTTRRGIVMDSQASRLIARSAASDLITPTTDANIEISGGTLVGIDPTGAGGGGAIVTDINNPPANLKIHDLWLAGSAALHGFARGIIGTGIQHGDIRNINIRQLRGQAATVGVFLASRIVDGGNLASANTLVIPAVGNTFRVTGNAQINAIDWSLTAETVVTLAFAGSLTVANSAGLQLLLGANYVTTAEVAAGVPTDFLIFQKASVNTAVQAEYHPLTPNWNTVDSIDADFDTGPTDAEKMGYLAIALRGGGSFNQFTNSKLNHCTSGQISIDSTTKFLDAMRSNLIVGNELTNLDALTVSPNGFQEAALEVAGRAWDTITAENEVFAARYFSYLFNEDGTYLSNLRTSSINNKSYNSRRFAFVDLGCTALHMIECTAYGTGVETSGLYDDFYTQAQPVAAAAPVGSVYKGNRGYGSRHRRVLNIASASGVQPIGFTAYDNHGTGYTDVEFVDQGSGTIYFPDGTPPAGPFARNKPVVAYKSSANNTLTAFLQITIPNLACDGQVRVWYVINSNTNLLMRAGMLNIPIGRNAGANAYAAIQEAIATNAGGTEAFTAVTFTLGAVAGAVGAVNTIDVKFTLNSTGGLQSNFHYEASALSDALNSGNAAAEITISAL